MTFVPPDTADRANVHFEPAASVTLVAIAPVPYVTVARTDPEGSTTDVIALGYVELAYA